MHAINTEGQTPFCFGSRVPLLYTISTQLKHVHKYTTPFFFFFPFLYLFLTLKCHRIIYVHISNFRPLYCIIYIIALFLIALFAPHTFTHSHTHAYHISVNDRMSGAPRAGHWLLPGAPITCGRLQRSPQIFQSPQPLISGLPILVTL